MNLDGFKGSIQCLDFCLHDDELLMIAACTDGEIIIAVTRTRVKTKVFFNACE